MEMNFCRRCGTKLTEKAAGAYVCENGHQIYASAFATVGIIFLTSDDTVLIATRRIDPGKGMLDLPGGFVEVHETAEEAIVREINEELGLTPEDYDTPQVLCTATSDYNYDGEIRPILSTQFWARLHSNAKPAAQDDVAGIDYVPLSSLNIDAVYGKDNRTGLKKFLEIQSNLSL